MQIVKDKISIKELKQMAEKSFGNLVKAVVDLEKEIMVVDADLHSDQEELLLKQGSKQENLWGINLYPNEPQEKMVEFDSMINLRPSFGNRSRGIDDPKIRKRIIGIVKGLIKE
jgi:hypothetical protein